MTYQLLNLGDRLVRREGVKFDCLALEALQAFRVFYEVNELVHTSGPVHILLDRFYIERYQSRLITFDVEFCLLVTSLSWVPAIRCDNLHANGKVLNLP